MYDVDKLAYSIAMHETGYGTKGVGKSKNNLCGIMRRSKFVRYKTKKASIDDCKQVITNHYADKSIKEMSKR